MIDKDIQEMIDACRPGSDDLKMSELAHLADSVERDSEVRDLYQRVQQFDAAVAEAFKEAPVPDGLEEKLLASLAWENDQAVADPADPGEDQAVAPVQRKASRRRWLWATAAVASAAAAVLVAAFVLMPQADPVTEGRFVASAYDGFDSLQGDQWNRDPAAADPDRPLSLAILGKPRAWQRIRTDYDSKTVVYDLTVGGQPTAMLLVTQPDVEVASLPTAPPINPPHTTGGRTAGVWREGDLVYVLMIEGPDQRNRYERLLRDLPELAWRPPRNVSPVYGTGKV